MDNQNTKPWYESKTIWIAILQCVLSVLVFIQGNPEIGLMGLAIGVTNIALRGLTTTTIQ